MNKPLLPEMPDEATHRRLTARLQAVAAEMRAWSRELQELEERFERDYQQSPIGQFHARLRAQQAEPPNDNTPRAHRMEAAMKDKPIPPIPDEPTRRRLREQMLAAAAELRKSTAELERLQEMFDRDYEESPIGQLHASWDVEKARLANGNNL